jgi:transcriptional regulator with XRE-family HTH domain
MLTQTELATRVGTTLRTIQRWETGERFPTPRFRRALCEALGVGYADLFASE